MLERERIARYMDAQLAGVVHERRRGDSYAGMGLTHTLCGNMVPYAWLVPAERLVLPGTTLCKECDVLVNSTRKG
jgi:hypothetical protein